MSLNTRTNISSFKYPLMNINDEFKNSRNRRYWAINEDFKLNRLINETYHIFSEDPKSIFRQAIKFIARDISQKWLSDNQKFKKVFKHPNDPLCKVYEYSKIFSGFELLEKLRIFVTYGDMYDGQSLISDKEIDNDLCVDFYNPSYYRDFDKILITTILIYIPEDILNNTLNNRLDIQSHLEQILTHELIHVFDSLWNNSLINYSNSANDKANNIEDLYVNVTLADINLLPYYEQYNVKTLSWLIRQCLYYTLKTEIHAHLETLYSCILVSSLKLADYKNTNDYLKHVWHEFNNILALKQIVNNIIQNEKTEFVYLHNDVKKILNILNADSKKQYTSLLPYFKYWLKTLNDLINKSQNIAYQFNTDK